MSVCLRPFPHSWKLKFITLMLFPQLIKRDVNNQRTKLLPLNASTTGSSEEWEMKKNLNWKNASLMLDVPPTGRSTMLKLTKNWLKLMKQPDKTLLILIKDITSISLLTSKLLGKLMRIELLLCIKLSNHFSLKPLDNLVAMNNAFLKPFLTNIETSPKLCQNVDVELVPGKFKPPR